ncbi:hypothetical protein ABZ208_35255 [Streptomyces sp. NPDC006208]|uniref:hypothetical protein n=1 Tax=Streptomyces sp. NPDC006208 TaxID=3156734 RepID=UPI0033A4415C
MPSSTPQSGPGTVIVGQRTWSPAEAEPVAATEGELPGISAFWVMYDPAQEEADFSKTLRVFPEHHLFTWSAAIAAAEPSPSAADRTLSLHRTGLRAGTKRFPAMPFMESVYRRYPECGDVEYSAVEPLMRKRSGYAFGIGPSTLAAEAWTCSAQLLESHFSLAFDVENSVALEAQRRKLVSLYLEVAVGMGIMPLVPLNRHPLAGTVIFCSSASYHAVADRLTTLAVILEGESGAREIARLAEAGGGMAYL